MYLNKHMIIEDIHANLGNGYVEVESKWKNGTSEQHDKYNKGSIFKVSQLYVKGTKFHPPSDGGARRRRFEPHALPVGWLDVLLRTRWTWSYTLQKSHWYTHYSVLLTSKWSDSFSVPCTSFSANREIGSLMNKWAMCCASRSSTPFHVKPRHKC